MQSSIIHRYNLSSHKISRFYLAPKNHNLLPSACTKTTNQNLIWDDFEQFICIDNFFPTTRDMHFKHTLTCHTSLKVGQNTKNSSLYLL